MTEPTNGLFGSENLSAEDRARLNELAAEGTRLRSSTEEAFATDLDGETAELVASQLVKTKDSSEAQLSYALFALRENRMYLNAGFDTFADYVETKLKFSSAKARNLIKRWEAFISLGLSSTVLTEDTGISWSKFGELLPGVRAGVITDQNIDVWLPLATNNGPYAMTNGGIATMVRMEVAEAGAEEEPDRMEKLSFSVTADDKANILLDIQTIQTATGILSTGDALRVALEAKVTEIATNSEDVRRNYGLSRIKDIAERMVPGIHVVFLANEEDGMTEDTLGIVPITRVYQRLDSPDSFTLAASDEDAAETLQTDVDNLISYPLALPRMDETVDTAYEEDDDDVDDVVYEDDDSTGYTDKLDNTIAALDNLDLIDLKGLAEDILAEVRSNAFLTEDEIEEILSIADNDGNEVSNWLEICNNLVTLSFELGIEVRI